MTNPTNSRAAAALPQRQRNGNFNHRIAGSNTVTELCTWMPNSDTANIVFTNHQRMPETTDQSNYGTLTVTINGMELRLHNGTNGDHPRIRAYLPGHTVYGDMPTYRKYSSTVELEIMSCVTMLSCTLTGTIPMTERWGY